LIRKLEKMDRLELDSAENSSLRFKFPPAPRSGKVVMTAEQLSKSFGNLDVFENVDLLIGRQEKVALVGKNGAGKTTLTRIITGLETHGGGFELGHNVEIGYYAQNQADELDPNKTVFETIDDEATGAIRTQVRSLLGSFLFSGEDIDKKVKVLSGGEKARLALCKLLLHPYNLLILDEPTNHLDMRSKDVLKEALRGYDGTLIVVSHDRDFLSDLTQMVYEVTPTGLKQHIGDIKAFLEARRSRSIAAYEADVEKKVEDVVKKENTHHLSYAERKDQGKRKRKLKTSLRKEKPKLKKLKSK